MDTNNQDNDKGNIISQNIFFIVGALASLFGLSALLYFIQVLLTSYLHLNPIIIGNSILISVILVASITILGTFAYAVGALLDSYTKGTNLLLSRLDGIFYILDNVTHSTNVHVSNDTRLDIN